MAKGSIDLGIISKFDNKGVSKARKSFKKFGGVAAGVATAAVGAIAGIGTAATRMASEFETSFAKIEGLVGVSKGEIETLSAAAQELGPQFGKSAQEAADALFFITSSGLRGAEATEVLEASLKASAAGLGDMSAVANAATAGVNTYGTEVLSGTDAVEALTEAARLGQFAPEELASSLGKVIQPANELGVSFEETTGFVAGLTKSGLSASEAVTGVRGTLQAFIKPTAEANEILGKYGTSAEEVKDSIEKDGLIDTLQGLRETIGDNDEDFSRLIGSQEGLNAVFAATGDQAGMFNDVIGQMTDNTDILDDALGVVEETAGQKFKVAMETAKASLLPVGDSLLEIGAQLLDDLMPTIELLAPLFEETFSHLQEPLGELAGLLPTLIEAFMPFLPIIGELVGTMVQLAVDLMPTFMSLLELLIPILDLLMPVLDVVVGLFDLLLGPIELLLDLLVPLLELGLTPVTTAFEFLSGAMGGLREVMDPLNETVFPAMLEHLGEYFAPVVDAAKEGLQELTDKGFQYLIDAGILPVGFSLDDLALDTPRKMRDFANAVIGGFNGAINAANATVSAIISVVNAAIAAAQALGPIFGGPLAFAEQLDESKFEIPTIEEMNISDFISDIEDVDVSGIGRNLEARFGQGSLSDRDFSREGRRGVTGSVSETQGFRSVGIPALAEGGIVDRATLAMIGE